MGAAVRRSSMSGPKCPSHTRRAFAMRLCPDASLFVKINRARRMRLFGIWAASLLLMILTAPRPQKLFPFFVDSFFELSKLVRGRFFHFPFTILLLLLEILRGATVQSHQPPRSAACVGDCICRTKGRSAEAIQGFAQVGRLCRNDVADWWWSLSS